MELFPIEIRPPFQPPSEDAKLVLLADGGIPFLTARTCAATCRGACAMPGSTASTSSGAAFSCTRGTSASACSGPTGRGRSAASPPCTSPSRCGARCARGSGPRSCTPSWETSSSASTRTSTTRRSSWTAALKGADAVLSVQCLDPAEETPERVLCTVWNAAQSNNVYVANFAAGGAVVGPPRARHPRGGRIPGAAHRRAARAVRASTWSGSTRSAPGSS